MSRLAAAADAPPCEIYRHLLLGHCRGALCARQAVRAHRPRNPRAFHLERAHAQASLRRGGLPRDPEIFRDASADRAIQLSWDIQASCIGRLNGSMKEESQCPEVSP